ncbi:MAG: Rrf2 family transcriptional regulator [Chloroflexi bacterium]|nr:Rrf2 family transcriptional regulator [Chloroflexota bacterium]
MRLSQRADYAAHAMVEIARSYGERPVHATDIAQRQGIPEPYLEQLLLALRRAALVRSYRGPGGGYTLTRPPAAISLADIVAALEGPFVPPEESLHDAAENADLLTCPIRDAWHLATATMRRILDGMTLEVLVQRQREIEAKRAETPQATIEVSQRQSPSEPRAQATAAQTHN